MKKHWSIMIRVLLAVAGIGYIAWSVDWVDKVEVRAGAPLGPGVTADGKILMPVVAGAVDPSHQAAPLTVRDPRGPQDKEHRREWIISPQKLNTGELFLIRPSFMTMLRHADLKLLLLGLLIIGPIFPVQAYRWLVLMRARGLDVSYAQALKLTMVGSFFNFCMPGSTGGDVIKAYYAARRSDRRTDSVMTVIFDRVTGLLGLITLAGIVGFFIFDNPLARKITLCVWLAVAVLAVCSVMYFSRRIRRWLGIDFIIARLPKKELFAKIDTAVMAYRDHKGAVVAAVLMSVPVHLAIASSAAWAGYAFGMKEVPFGLLLTVLPVVFLSGAVPITPQGAGVWELLAWRFLHAQPGVTMNQIVAMLVMARLYQLAYSLIGSIFLLKGDVHMHPERDAANS